MNSQIKTKDGRLFQPPSFLNKTDILSAVYIIHHVASGKMYVGSSGNIQSRLQGHERMIRNGNHENKALKEATLLDPRVTFQIVVTNNRDEALKYEQELVDVLYPTGVLFNTAEDVVYPMLGKTHSDEVKDLLRALNVGKKMPSVVKEKIRNALLGRIVSLETREKLRQINTGKTLSTDHRAKIGLLHKGKSLSSEHLKVLRESNLGRKQSPETRAKINLAKRRRSPPVVVAGVNYENIFAAMDARNMSYSSVMNRIRSTNPDFKDWYRPCDQ